MSSNYDEIQISGTSFSVREVEINKKLNQFLQTYEKLFTDKYGSVPIRLDNDEEVARWAATKLESRAIDLLTTYFGLKGDDEWYLKQAHSLHCFRQNINKIVSHQKAKNTNENIWITTKITCDKCFQYFDLTCNVAFLYDSDNLRLCDKCKPMNK